MGNESVQVAVQSLKRYLAENPGKSVGKDAFARARLTDRLMTIVDGPSGQKVPTDMPEGIGGEGAAPTPGW